MSLPDEKFRAIIYARNFLRDLMNPAKTKRIPREIRRQAYRCIKHFPYMSDLQKLAEKCPEILTADESMVKEEYGEFLGLFEKKPTKKR